MPKLLTIAIVVGATLWVAPAHAWSYLSGYSGGGGSHYSSGGGYSRLSIGGRSCYRGVSTSGAGYIERKHSRSYARLRRQKRIEEEQAKIRNANPPCGNYGRMPAYCKRGATNVAER